MADHQRWDDYRRARRLVADELEQRSTATWEHPDARTNAGPIDHLVVAPSGAWALGVITADEPVCTREGRLFHGAQDVHALLRAMTRRANAAAAELHADVVPALVVTGAMEPGTPPEIEGVRLVPIDRLLDTVEGASDNPVLGVAERRGVIERAEAWVRATETLAARALPLGPTAHIPAAVPQATRRVRRGGGSSTAASIAVIAALVAAAAWVLADADRRERIAGWIPFGADTERVHVPTPNLDPLEAWLLCEDGPRLVVAVDEAGAGPTDVTVTIDGIPHPLGEIEAGDETGDGLEVRRGANVVVTATWRGSDRYAAGSKERSFRIPAAACVNR